MLPALGQSYAGLGVGENEKLTRTQDARTQPWPAPQQACLPTIWSFHPAARVWLGTPPLLFHSDAYVALCFAELSELVGSGRSHSESGRSEVCGCLKSESGPWDLNEPPGLPFPFPGNVKAQRREVVCLNLVATSVNRSWAISFSCSFRCSLNWQVSPPLCFWSG